MILTCIRHWLTPQAQALDLSQIGQGAPGVSDMWNNFQSIFPFALAGPSTPGYLFGRVAYLVFWFTGFVAVALVVYAAMRLSAAGFNEEGKAEAKRVLTNVGIGLILALVSDLVIFSIAYVITLVANN